MAIFFPVVTSVAQPVVPGVGAGSPADIDRSSREAIQQAAAEPIQTDQDMTRLVWEQLQTGDSEAAEKLLAELDRTGTAGPVFQLQRIEFDRESGILTQGQLVEIKRQYEGRRASFADLLRVVVSINTAYRDAGYPLARANLPPQDVEGGVVQIQLIEARLGGARIEKSSVPHWMLRSYIFQKQGEVINLSRLERGLLWYNRTRASSLGSLLEAGADFGTTDVLLQLDEQDRHSLTYVVDNAGRESVGLLRQIAVFNRRNVFWTLEDNLTLGGIYSEGVQSFYGGYDVFLPGRLPMLSMVYSQGKTEVIDGAFQALSIKGESWSFEAAVTQPIIVTRRWLVQTALRYLHTWSETDFAGLFLQEETVDTISLEFSASRLDKSGGWFGLQQFRYIQGESAAVGESDTFYALAGSLLRQQRITRNVFATVEARYQYGDEGLPTSERFALGGVQSLRGYPESGTLADKGGVARAEISWMPLLHMRSEKPKGWGALWRDLVGSVEPFAFVDYGMAMDVELFDGSAENRTLGSAGAGARFAMSKYLSASAVWAQPFDLQEEQEAQNFLFRLEVRLPW